MKRILAVLLVVIAIAAIAVYLVRTANTPPTAESAELVVQEDTPGSIVLSGSDPDGDQLTWTVIMQPSHGTLSGTAPELTYNPGANFHGTDSLTFKVNDGRLDSATATAKIVVESVNDPPEAHDDAVETREDAPVAIVDVLANDADPDGDKLVVIEAGQGANGSVRIGADNKLAYTPNKNFSGTDTFTYSLSDGRGGTDKATVRVTVDPVNDAPSITSKPSETTRVWASYTYDVEAVDPDPGDSLVYSLTKQPEGMTIDPQTGLIKWMPTNAQAGTFDIVIRVADNNKVRAWDTQSYTLTVASLSSPLTVTLVVTDCFNQKGRDTLSARDKVGVLRTGDDDRVEIEARSYTCCRFDDPAIPSGATVVSMIVYVKHFEHESFRDGRLQWSVGRGWPDDPVVWASTDVPVRRGRDSEATDSWDVTSSVDSPEKANSLNLQIKNDEAADRTTHLDSVYAVVKWY